MTKIKNTKHGKAKSSNINRIDKVNNQRLEEEEMREVLVLNKTNLNNRIIKSGEKLFHNAKEQNRMIKLATINIRSLIPKIDEVRQMIYEEEIDILNIQETWILEERNLPSIKGYIRINTTPVKVRGTGLISYIRETLKIEDIIINSLNEGIEMVIFKIVCLKRVLSVGNVYLHPPVNRKMVTRLKCYLDEIGNCDILMGDFNSHNVKWSKGTPNEGGKYMMNLIREYGYKVINNKNIPTHYNSRIQKTGSPDLILVKNIMKNMIVEWEVGKDVNSDHLPVSIKLREGRYFYNVHRTQHWIFKKCDKDKFSKCIENDSDTLLKMEIRNEVELNNFYENMTTMILKNATKYCPRTKNSTHIRGNPWWNNECRDATLNKLRMRRQLMNNPDKLLELYYKEQVKITRGVIRRAKKQYFEKLAREKNINELFLIIKNLSKPKTRAIEVINGNNKILKSEEAANSICEFFANIGSKYSTKRRSERQRQRNMNLNKSLPELYNVFLNSPIEKQNINELVNNLNMKKAAGRDKIAPFMLRMGGDMIINLLKKLFDACTKIGRTPKIWNKGLIIPIQKVEGMRINIDKFRPICLLSVIGKVFEKLINKRLSEVSSKLVWLPRFQSGFVKNKSTINNLVELQQEIHRSFKNNEFMVTIFLDIKKAYDSVNRIKLMQIIENTGIRGNVLEYIRFFLSDSRRNMVCFNKQYSSDKKYSKGVPQGSPLSPLLFNIYMKDISSVVNDNILQFADDIVIWAKNKDIHKAIRRLEIVLKELSNWLDIKELSLAPEKCIPIIFTRKRKYNKEVKIKIGGKYIEFRDKAKYLGLIFDKNLTWKYHVKDMLPKCEKRLGILKYVCWKYKIKQNIALNL